MARTRGSLNKIGFDVSNMAYETLVGLGGKEYLARLATTKPHLFVELIKNIMTKPDSKVDITSDGEPIVLQINMPLRPLNVIDVNSTEIKKIEEH